MAANQISNQQRAGSSGGQRSSSSSHLPTSQSGSNVSPGGSGEHESWSDFADQAADYWNQGEDQVRELIRDREGTAILIALATGVGVGLVLGSVLGHAQQRPKSWRDRLTAEGFGRRLMDRIEAMIPDAFAEHFNR